MSFAVGRLLRGQPRFFDGSYVSNKTIPIPVTTGAPEKAHAYEDRLIAQVMADAFNAFDGLQTRVPQRHWIVVDLPEAWTA